MAEQTTCGEGLAEHSPLPAKLGELAAAMASHLELHTKALDPNDESSGKELAAYLRLAREYRDVAAQLRAIGDGMAGYRDLPMGRHDMNVMTSREVASAFERLVTVERELLAVVAKQLREHEEMLSQ